MGGNATFSGTTYQARVVAYVYVHVLDQRRLGWLELADDVPVAVAGETGGPGDDARVEFGERHTAIEVQAKHGITGVEKLVELVEGIGARSRPGDESEVILAVDRQSSRWLYGDLARDLGRLRCGRKDDLGAHTKAVLSRLSNDDTVLRRLHILPVDLDHPHDPERKSMVERLGIVLEEVGLVEAALDVLVADAADLCARKLRRTRKDLVDILVARGIKVRPPPRDDPWHRRLDFSRDLLREHHAIAALLYLDKIGADLGDQQVDALVRYRLAVNRSAALNQMQRFREALSSARAALDIDKDGEKALINATEAAIALGDLDVAREFADRATRRHPEMPGAWVAMARVASFAGLAPPDPPPGITTSAEFMTGLERRSV